jgi:hypothetical protein
MRTIVNCANCQASVLVIEVDEQACCRDGVPKEVNKKIEAAGWQRLDGGGVRCTECRS